MGANIRSIWLGGLIIGTMGLVSVVSARPNTLLLATYELKPYVSVEKGHFSGNMIKQVRQLCAAAGVTCYFELLPKLDAEWLVRRGKVDGFFPAEWTRERAAAMVFSQPLISADYGLYQLVRAGQAAIDRSGLKRIGAEEESSDYLFAKHWTDKRIQDYQLKPFLSLDIAFYALNKGYIDGVYANNASAQWWLAQGHYRTIQQVSTDKHLRYHIAFGTRTVPPQMAQRFDRAYWALLRSGDINKVS